MGKSKHTPGPWRVDPVCRTLVVGTKDPMPCIADTEACSPFDVEIDAANARLIAAAPELLKALKEIVGEIDTNFIGTLANDPGSLTERALKKLVKRGHAAIAKATGGEG